MRIGGRILGGCLVACALVLAAACGGDDDGGDAARATVPSSTSSTSTTSSSTTTTAPPPEFEPLVADPSLTPEEQVEQAYLFSWEVFRDALASGRYEHLSLAFGGEMLEFRVGEITRLVDEGQVVRGQVEHDPDIHIVGPEEAVVFDVIHNNLVRHDAASGDPLEEPPNQTVVFQFVLRLEGDRWLVIDGAQV